MEKNQKPSLERTGTHKTYGPHNRFRYYADKAIRPYIESIGRYYGVTPNEIEEELEHALDNNKGNAALLCYKSVFENLLKRPNFKESLYGV